MRYELSEDPHLLKTGSITYDIPCLISLSPDARSLAIAGGNNMTVYSTVTGEEEESMEHIYSGEKSSIEIYTLASHICRI